MGRKKRAKFEDFLTIAWFNTISAQLGLDSPLKLEKRFRPNLVTQNQNGKWVDSRAWGRYKTGKRTPREGVDENGYPYAVTAAAKVVPDSLRIYRHPLWQVLKEEKMSFEGIVEMLDFYPAYVSRYYMDLSNSSPENQFPTFCESIGMPIWVHYDDDHDRALDHLAVQLATLKMDNFKHLPHYLEQIAKNIVRLLGPLSRSCWFCAVFEEFFDYLERSVWKDLFDKYYENGIVSVSGWRKTRKDWISW